MHPYVEYLAGLVYPNDPEVSSMLFAASLIPSDDVPGIR
jgi:hypothetical protein